MPCPAQLQDLIGGKGTKRRQTHWHRKLASMTECLLHRVEQTGGLSQTN